MVTGLPPKDRTLPVAAPGLAEAGNEAREAGVERRERSSSSLWA